MSQQPSARADVAPAGAAGAGALRAAYRALAARRARVLLTLLAVALVGLVADIATGPAFLRPGVVLAAIVGQPVDPSVEAIVWTIRLPVALTALAVGAALGLSGAVMQTILHNPLASSYTLGISAGAGFGASLAIVLGWSLPVAETYAIAGNAVLFAAIACAAVYWIGGGARASAEGLVLAGIACLFLFQALTSLLQMVASPEALQQVVFWLFGSLQKATWAKLAVLVGVLALGLPLIAREAWSLTALKLGDARAEALGVAVRALRMRCFLVISALTGVAVAFVGTIGFIGLVAPHVARMTIGEDQRAFLPASVLSGAALLSLASVASKLVRPGAIIPVGIVTALIGVPFFIAIVLRRRGSFW